jgi:hypothetical protein
MPGLTDTPPEIAAMVRERLMARSNAERFEMGCRMFDAARAMILASLPGDRSEDERRRLLFERVYGMPMPRGSERRLDQRNMQIRTSSPPSLSDAGHMLRSRAPTPEKSEVCTSMRHL